MKAEKKAYRDTGYGVKHALLDSASLFRDALPEIVAAAKPAEY